MKKIIIFILSLCFLSAESKAQCYLKYTDASGMPMLEYDLQTLKDSACALKNVFPIEVKDSFAVVDFGFYSHNQNMVGGYPEFMNLMIKRLATDPKTKYYLLFGRESNSDRPNTKIWVKVVLPYNTYFNCVWQDRQNILNESMRMVSETPTSRDVYKTEIECISIVKNLVLKYIDCCNEGRSDECSPDGVIVTANDGLKTRLLSLLNTYIGTFTPEIFDIKMVGNISRLTVRTLKHHENFSDDKRRKLYDKVKLFTSPIDAKGYKVPDANIYLVDENTSVYLENGTSRNGKSVYVDEYDTGIIDVGDMEMSDEDATRAFFHFLSEQYLKKLERTRVAWIKYITSKNGKIFDSEHAKDPTYDICHAYTVQEEASVFEYCFPFFKEEKFSGTSLKRTSTDKATFKIVFDDNYINNETFEINTYGSKKLFDVTIKFKALDNLTIISYEKKTY